MKQESITIISKRMKKKIRIADILYIIKSEYLSLIHLIDGDILQTITPIYELKEMLGDDCIEVKKGCIVSVSAITNIKDKIYLCNGEAIDFTVRRRKAVRLEWREKQKLMILMDRIRRGRMRNTINIMKSVINFHLLLQISRWCSMKNVMR